MNYRITWSRDGEYMIEFREEQLMRQYAAWLDSQGVQYHISEGSLSLDTNGEIVTAWKEYQTEHEKYHS